MKTDEKSDIEHTIMDTAADASASVEPRGPSFSQGETPHGSAEGDTRTSPSGAGVFEKSNNISLASKRCVIIALSQLPADGRVRIRLHDDQTSSWAMGDAKADLVGIAVETASRNSVLKLNSFVVNRRELIFSTYAACDEIRITIYLQCIGGAIRGYVDLPLGASATFQSEVDRTSLIGLSSFCLSFLE